MTETKYYKKYTGKSGSIVDALASIGVKDTSLAARKKIAKLNGITNYSGTASQNTKLLKKLKKGKLIKSVTEKYPLREKFLSKLQAYNPVLKEYGKLLHYSWDDSESTFAKAEEKLKNGKETGLTCVVPCRWALKDIGISPAGFWAQNGTFKACYKGDIAKHLERITSGSAIGKTTEQAVNAKLLMPGDILAFKDKTHTFVYTGAKFLMYDGGHNANYPMDGITVDYAKHYPKAKISEILRWKD